jgi:putative heme-binding domain-containing protein
MELGSATALKDMKLIGARPQHETFGVPNAMLVAPAEPDRSILAHRMARRGAGQMPPLVTKAIDHQAVQLMRDWIASLKPAREFVRQWQMEDVLPELEQIAAGRSLASGEAAFRDTGCIQCHRFGSEGGTVGPNLTDVAKRAKPHEVLESILLPSKVIADEYAAYAFETAEGKVVSGRIEREDDRVLLVRPPATTDPPVEIAKSDVVERHRLDRSNMPAGTVDVLNMEELLDLVAYLLSKPERKANSSP